MIRETIPFVLCICLAPMRAQQGDHSQPVPPANERTSAAPVKGIFFKLPKGTQVNLVLLEALSSATAEKGQSVRLAVAQDLTAGGFVAIAAGTPVSGVVSFERKSTPGKRDGYLWFKPTCLTLQNGFRIKLLEQPPGWNRCGGMGTLCFGYVAMAPYSIVGLASLLFESQHHPDEPGKDTTHKACWPLTGFTAAKYGFWEPASNAVEPSSAVSPDLSRLVACHPEFPPLPYNYGAVDPPTAKLE